MPVTLNDILAIIIVAFILLRLSRLRDEINYLENDENFKEDSKWPKWLIDDAKKWNRDNPNKQVKVREQI
jgi:hypothetical protein